VVSIRPLLDRGPCNAVHLDGSDLDGLDFSNSTSHADGWQLAENALLFVGIAAHGCIALSGEIALFLALHARRQIGRSRLPMSDRGLRDARRRRGCQGALRWAATTVAKLIPAANATLAAAMHFELSRAMDTPP
jgi:hypothetical protein